MDSRSFAGGKADYVCNITQRQRCNDIDHGVLLEKHGGHADQQGSNGEKQPPEAALQTDAVPCCAGSGERTHNVKRGADVCAGVEGVELQHKPNQQIVP